MTIHSNGINPVWTRCGTAVVGKQRKLTIDDWGQVTCKRCLGSYRNPDGYTVRQTELRLQGRWGQTYRISN